VADTTTDYKLIDRDRELRAIRIRTAIKAARSALLAEMDVLMAVAVLERTSLPSDADKLAWHVEHARKKQERARALVAHAGLRPGEFQEELMNAVADALRTMEIELLKHQDYAAFPEVYGKRVDPHELIELEAGVGVLRAVFDNFDDYQDPVSLGELGPAICERCL
jgi:hypothetical protein